MNKEKSILQYPYIIWSIMFIIIPIFLVIYFSLTNKNGSFTFENYKRLFNAAYVEVFLKSIYLSVVSTLICFIIGYPSAYFLSRLNVKMQNILLLLLIIPMWMNFLLRTYAWMSIIGKNGIINTFLKSIGFHKINILYTNAAVILGMVYNFLPFMIMPIYTVLQKIDSNIIKAAEDLGADKHIVFRRIIFPLSIPGIMSGLTMVFMPAVSTFVISNLLGGGQFMLIGNLIEIQFTTACNWYFGSAISIIMMLIILVSMIILSKFSDNSESSGLSW